MRAGSIHLSAARAIGVTSRKSRRPRGRPKGPETVPFKLRLAPEQRRDLDVFHQIMDGHPSVNGLIQTAVQQYIDRKLKEDPNLRSEYDRRVSPRLRVVRADRHLTRR